MKCPKALYRFFLLFLLCLELSFSSMAQQWNIVTATFLGGSGNNTPVGVGFSANENIIVAGNFDTIAGNFNMRQLFSSTNFSKGKLIRLDATGRSILEIVVLGNEIYDFDIQNTYPYNILVTGDFGIALLDGTNMNVVWQKNAPATGTILSSIDDNGEIAVYVHRTIYCLDVNGNVKATSAIFNTAVNDIAFIGGLIFITGYNSDINTGYELCSLVKGNQYDPIDIAYLSAYKYNFTTKLALQYNTWNFNGKDMSCDMANTAGYKITQGLDGYIYFLGEASGPRNIFRWDGKTNWKLNGGSDPPGTYVVNDLYSSLDNLDSGTVISYVAKISPNDGSVVSGQFITSRDSVSKGNTYRVNEGSICAIIPSDILIGGEAGNSIRNRDFSNSYVQPFPYAGGDPAISIFSPSSYYSMSLWDVLTGENGSGSFMSVASRNLKIASLGRVDKGAFLTINALYETPFNASETDDKTDVFLAVWNYAQITTLPSSAQTARSQRIVLKDNVIDVGEIPKLRDMQIFNLQGKSMNEYNTSQTQVSLKNYASGFYIVRMVCEDGVIVEKIFLP